VDSDGIGNILFGHKVSFGNIFWKISAVKCFRIFSGSRFRSRGSVTGSLVTNFIILFDFVTKNTVEKLNDRNVSQNFLAN
jgi:hypothetical protein